MKSIVLHSVKYFLLLIGIHFIPPIIFLTSCLFNNIWQPAFDLAFPLVLVKKLYENKISRDDNRLAFCHNKQQYYVSRENNNKSLVFYTKYKNLFNKIKRIADFVYPNKLDELRGNAKETWRLDYKKPPGKTSSFI